jgi:Lipid A 3-O-deacylase (PagL)
MWRVALTLSALGLGYCGLAQGYHALGLRMGHGFLAPHVYHMRHLQQGPVGSLELFYERTFSGLRAWHADLPGTAWGVHAQYLALGNPVQLGHAYTAGPYVRLPMDRKLLFALRLGVGLGAVEKPFQREENYRNHAVGSYLNCALHILVEARKTLGPLAFGLGVGLDHLSNGSTRMPNLGVNIPCVRVAVQYDRPRTLTAPVDSPDPGPRTQLYLLASAGARRTFPVDGPLYTALTLWGNAYRRISPRSLVGAGVDIFHSVALAPLLRNQEGEQTIITRTDLLQGGVHLAYAFTLGKLHLVVEQGAYLHTAYKERGLLYQRFGLRHEVGRRWLLGLTLKTHLTTADHMEMGVGYRLW